jgi:hypothetical protein
LKAFMTSTESTALVDKVVPGSGAAKALQRHADNLESVSGLLHSSAYQPANQAIRLLRRLSHERSFPAQVHAHDLQATAELLRHFANTVSARAGKFMQDAARALQDLAA